MEKLRNPKNVKTISLIVAAIFVIGCFTLAMSAGYRRGQLSGSGFPVSPFGTDSERYAEGDCGYP